MSVCPQCGATASGAFCTSCGANVVGTVPSSPDPSTSSRTEGVTRPGTFAPNVRGESAAPPSRPVVTDTPTLLPGPFRTSIVWETRLLMLAFLAPVVTSAVIVLSQHVAGTQNFTDFPMLVHHQPVTNLILLILAYLPVASTVPITLLLLSRTGQGPKVLGMGFPSFTQDVIPGLGIGALSFLSESSSSFPSPSPHRAPRIGHEGCGRIRAEVLHHLWPYPFGDDGDRRGSDGQWLSVDETPSAGLVRQEVLGLELDASHELPRLLRLWLSAHRALWVLQHPVISEAPSVKSSDRGPLSLRRHTHNHLDTAPMNCGRTSWSYGVLELTVDRPRGRI